MELWIRVQDNKILIPGIVKVDNLFVEEDPAENFAWGIRNNGDTLGLYSSKERALEVLDEIQNILKPKLLIKNEGKMIYGRDGNIYNTNIVGNENTEIQELSTYVYEMPEN